MSIDTSRIIVALDFSDKNNALNIVRTLEGWINFYKIGLELFINEGPDIINQIKRLNKKIFLDLKLHDIPNTVYKAIKGALQHDIDMLTVHTTGGFHMLQKAVEAVKEHAFREDLTTKIIGVTSLTSLNEQDLQDIGINLSVVDFVKRLALMAKNAGLDGVVSSAHEVNAIKELCGQSFLVVTPGIRIFKAESNDQKRTVTPKEAFLRGADYIVVGRAITSSQNPLETIQSIFQ
ncbi:orotidine-5'-phosphate decarboxylase [Thermodesulfovibrio thiophilus]|uniref:orotidine-5'-phosphate decarboxylase n=1 Tax=Thermodesulfovibrio thiophilus TaxID=340095 RepID=UPI0003FE4235|nr:orotidine-5'-phosphate decarboxylase [Thermodesulfovibrio thiophilus]